MRWIPTLYNYDTYRASARPNNISATGLLGPLYKMKLKLEDTPKDPAGIDIKFKRSSMIGTAVHERAEKAFAGDSTVIQEVYHERMVLIDGITYWVSGTCDLLQREEDYTYTITDFKTGYGKKRDEKALAKDAMQMSIYRWLLQDIYEINDTAYSLFISQSNNEEAEYPLELTSIDDIQNYIEERIWAATQQQTPDCNDNIRYNGCQYCDLSCSHRQ